MTNAEIEWFELGVQTAKTGDYDTALQLAQIETEALMATHGTDISFIEHDFHDLWPFVGVDAR